MSFHNHAGLCEPLEPRRLLSVSFDWGLGGGCTGKAEVTATVSDADGSVYVLGRFSGALDVDPSADEFLLTALGESDMFVIKYSADQELVWAHSAGGTDGQYYPSDIALLPDGGMVIVGSFTGTVDLSLGEKVAWATSNGGEDAFIIFPQGHTYFGGPYYDAIRTVDTSLGYPIIGGVFSKTVHFPQARSAVTSAGRQDGFVGRYFYDADVNTYFTIGGSGYDVVNEIHVDPATLEISVVGTMEGTVNFGPGAVAAENGEFAPVYLTSHGGKDAYFARYNSFFRNVFAEHYGGAGDDWGDAMAVGPSGAYIAGMFTQPMNGLTSTGGSDVFVKKIGGAMQQIGSADDDAMGTLAIDSTGRLIVTGRYTAPITFNDITLPHEGKADVFLATYDSTFAPETIVGLRGPYRDTVTALTTAPGGAVYVGGSFQRRIDLGVGDISELIHGNAVGEFYLTRLIIA